MGAKGDILNRMAPLPRRLAEVFATCIGASAMKMGTFPRPPTYPPHDVKKTAYGRSNLCPLVPCHIHTGQCDVQHRDLRQSILGGTQQREDLAELPDLSGEPRDLGIHSGVHPMSPLASSPSVRIRPQRRRDPESL